MGLDESNKQRRPALAKRAGLLSFSVIPAEAGIQECQELLDPGFRRGDGLERIAILKNLAVKVTVHFTAGGHNGIHDLDAFFDSHSFP